MTLHNPLMLAEDLDLSLKNTLNLPSKAEYFSTFSSLPELLHLLNLAKEKKLSVKILGGGSNVLVSEYITGLVLQSAMTDIQVKNTSADYVDVEVEAGVNWHQWVNNSQQYGHGLENLALIPGTVGASPIQNIGAYGVEVSDYILAVKGMCLNSLKIKTLSAEECCFSYRDSIFKRELNNQFIVTSVIFRLNKLFNPNVNYGPLANWSASLKETTGNEQFTSQDLIHQVCSIRNSKLPNPSHIPNAGSFFKNPVVSCQQSQELLVQYPQMPNYPQENNTVKVAAGWLLEQAGWKGRTQGNVGLHNQQALVLTTNGQASLSEVCSLKDQIVKDIQSRFGITLEVEPQLFE